MSTWERLSKLPVDVRERLLSELDNVSERDLKDRFDATLDDIYGTVKIAGFDYPTSDALYCVDATAYRCAFADWVSEASDTLEWNGRYFMESDVSDALDALDDEENL